jgi:hypothetical protein
MKLLYEKAVTFVGEGPLDRGATLTVRYDNRGEPYRSGITLMLDDHVDNTTVFLQEYEARMLVKLINELYPPRPNK